MGCSVLDIRMDRKGFIRPTQIIVRDRCCRMSSQGYFIIQELAGTDRQSQAIYHPRVFPTSSSVSSTW